MNRPPNTGGNSPPLTRQSGGGAFASVVLVECCQGGDRSRLLKLVPVPSAWLLALAISVLYVLILAYPVHLHRVGGFSDFYVRFAPDADRIAAGEFPQNTYNPPGYPVLLALASPLTGDHFTSGKWMSLLAAGLIGVLIFCLVRRLFGPGPALLAVPIVLLSHSFTTYSITAMADVPFLCVCLGALLATTIDRPARWWPAILGGLLSGAAYLIRYNGVFLLVPGLLGMLWREDARTSGSKLGAVYLGSFLLTIASWGWLNYTHHGSPVYSTNYLDVVRAFRLDGGGRPFTSFADVVSRDPGRLAWGYAGNVGPTLVNGFGASLALLPVGPLAAVGIVLSLVRHRRRPVILVLVGALTFVLLMSFTHWERRYHFFPLACYSGFAAFAVFQIGHAVGRILGSPMAARIVMTALVLVVVIPSGGRAWDAVRISLKRQPIELLPAARYLDSVAPPGATVMAVRAQIAYLSRRQFRELPNAGSVDELRSILSERPPDYIVFDRWGRFRRSLTTLAKPDGSIPWLNPVFNDGAVVVYAVQLDRR